MLEARKFLGPSILFGALLILLAFVIFVVLDSCSSMPSNIRVVSNFKVDAYLGKWYEIARFDFKHEKNLSHVTAEYSLNEDGTIKVVNMGYDYVARQWKESVGKAKPVNKRSGQLKNGALKVSFFGPFYSGYNVVAIDDDYQYVLVVGNSLKYIWILSRTPDIPEDVKQNYLELAQSMGYNTDNLVWTLQQ